MTPFRSKRQKPSPQGDTRAFSQSNYDDGSLEATDIIADAHETFRFNTDDQAELQAHPMTNPTKYTRAYDENYSTTGSNTQAGSGPNTQTNPNSTGSHERVISQMHQHPRRLFLPALITIAAPGAVAYFYGSFDINWQNILVLVAGLSIIVLFGTLPLLFWLSTNYTITTRRVVIRRGLLTQIRQELLHSRSYDITVRRGPLQRMSGSGDVEINAGLEQPIILKNIPDVVLVQQVLQELMERSASSIAYRRQRGEAQGRRR